MELVQGREDQFPGVGNHEMPAANEDWRQKIPFVSVLTKRIRGTLENQFLDVWVRGEVSNLKQPTSGHAYFILKDATAQ